MDDLNKPQNTPLNTPDSERLYESRLEEAFNDSLSGSRSKGSTTRAKSSQRLLYEAETEIFIKKVGDLEDIRTKLGLSQRKMCQLLMVDPSAWTRWTRPEQKAPPHIYRSLQWYLALQDMYPELKNPYWLSAVANVKDQKEAVWEQEKSLFVERMRKDFVLMQSQLINKVRRQLLLISVASAGIIVLILLLK